MADYLRIEHWVDKCVELLGADLTLRAAGYTLIEPGDFERVLPPGTFRENLPAILVSAVSVEPDIEDLSGESDGMEIVLRAVAYHVFEDATRLVPERARRLGELANAFRLVQHDATKWTGPDGTDYAYQFFFTKPESWELEPDEEGIFVQLDGYQNTFAVAVSHRLTLEARPAA